MNLQDNSKGNLTYGEELYRSLFTDNQSVMLLINPDTGEIIDANPAASSFYGWSISEICRKNISEINTLEKEDIIAEMQKAKEEKRKHFEFKHRLANGSIRDVEIYSGPILHGESTLLYSLIHDITERKLNELALKESEALYHSILQASPDNITITDLGGIILFASAKALEMFGYEQIGQFMNRNINDFIAQEDKERAVQEIVKMHQGILSGPGEYKALRFDGSIFDVEVNGEFIRNTEGIPIKMVFVVRDITERKTAEELRNQQLFYTKALNDIAECIIKNDNAVEILETANRIIGETLQLDRALIYDVSFDKNIITGLCEWLRLDHPEIAPTKGEYPIGMFLNPLTEVKNTRKFIESHSDAVNDFFKHDGSGEILHQQMNIKSLIWYPFSFYENGYYLFTLNQILEHRQWTTADIGFLESVTNQIGFALVKIKLLEELRQREEALNLAQEIAKMGSWEHNLLKNELKGSYNNDRLLGLGLNDKKENLYDYFFSLVHPDDIELLKFIQEGKFKEGETKIVSHRIILPDGTVKWLQNNIVPVFNSGKLVALQGVNIDITEIKLAEEKIRFQNERLNAIIKSMPDLIFVSDRDGNYLEYFKPEKAELLIPEEKLIGSNVNDAFDKETANLHIAKIEECLRTNTLISYEYNRKLKDKVSYFEARLISLGNDTVLRFVRDITDTKNKEKKIKELNTNLERKVEERTQQLSETNENLRKLVEERTQIYEALKESESRFSLFMDYLPALVFIKDFDSRMIYSNNAMDISLGASQWVGKSLFELFDRETAERIIEDDKKTIQTGYQIIEESFQNLNGEIHHYETQKFVIPREGREFLLGGIALDITKRKQAEELLEQTRHNYETFFNTIDDFLFVLDEQGNMIHTNNTVINRLEYTTEELLSKSVLMVHPAERREEAGRIVGEMLAGTSDYCPVPLVTKSGKEISVETRVKPGFWDGKAVIFGVSKDVSQLVISEEKFSRAFHSSSALMAISGYEDGIYIDVNDTFVKTLEFSRNEIIGNDSTKLNVFVKPENRSLIYSELKESKEVKEIEIEFRAKSGKIITGLFSADFIYVGNRLCLLTLVVDITERKKADEETKKARLEAEKANHAKSEFLSRMSHELRTPMNSILGFAQLLQLGEPSNPQKKGLNHILNSGKHLLNLIDEVLDISSIEAGKYSLSLEPVQIGGIIREMMDVIQPLATARNIRFEFIYSAEDKQFVSADRQKLKQVLLNLLNNAVKYNRENGFIIVSTKSILQEDGSDVCLRISITDSGLGIDAENIPKLFIPFERIGAEKSQVEGTGLGLALSKKMVETMGGKIGVESIKGEKTTFWIELTQIQHQIERPEKAGLIKASGIKPSENSGTILYIEDNESNIELVREVLSIQRPGMQLVTSFTGGEAIELAVNFKPDLILLDLDLPDIHGSEVFERLKEDKRTNSIPVIIISADAMPDQPVSLLNAGVRQYLTKPFDLIKFIEEIDKWTGTLNNINK